jgi:hypothetical protein
MSVLAGRFPHPDLPSCWWALYAVSAGPADFSRLESDIRARHASH